jgi:hypothetical protein
MRYAIPAAVLLAAACVEPSTEVPLDQDFELALGQSVAIAGTAQRVTFDAVTEDSRCPTDAVCVWAGNARVSLRVSAAGTDSTVALNTGLEPRFLTVNRFRLELRGLIPAPRAATPTPPDAYRATLRVTGT